MCGLSGYYNFDRPAETKTEVVVEMLSLIRHRGPDDSGIVAVNVREQKHEVIEHKAVKQLIRPADIIFGFNRLSVLDLSHNGHQPMIGAEGSVILMMNGEIYNAFDFRPELEQMGFQFKSTTDTEVVLNLYLAYGFAKMIGLLNGMFAITIYDQRKQKLYLARDRFGIKPLYILQENGRLAFSSELKAFKALPDFKFRLAGEHIDEFLLFRNLINKTLFQNIFNLTPGTYWEVTPDGRVEQHVYYQLSSPTSTTVNFAEATDVLEQHLKRSVHRQLMSDVKLGCQLSGGVDSSLVTYYASDKVKRGQLETISIVFDQNAYSEENYVDQVAEKLALKAHKFTLDASYYLEHLDRATWHFEQPLNHPNTVGIYLLSEEARKHVTVLLSGEGADEILAGYGRFGFAARNYLTSRNFLSKLKQNRSQLLPFLKLALKEDDRMIMGAVTGSLSAISLLRPEFSLKNAMQHRRAVAEALEGPDLLRFRKYELLTFLPDLLMRQDKMSMAHSIENRVPFLDNELVDKVLQFPDRSLLRDKNGAIITKYALKKLCADKFSHPFAFRSKMGFGIPLKSFMDTAYFRDKVNDEIFPKMKDRGIFKANAMKAMASNIGTASADQLDAIWLMTGFEVWAQKYLDA